MSGHVLDEIRRCVVLGDLAYTRHARQRMRQRAIAEGDVACALLGARLAAAAPEGRWKITGPDLEGDDLAVVVAIDVGVVVVTVY
jgi:hypothetical protein